jgi:phosphoribosylformylglycinamidine cyclo-ligase
MTERERPVTPSTYEQSGVSYADMDPFKIAAQEAALSTANNLRRLGYQEILASRGESAYVWDEGDKYGAMVTEGLGTKNLVADAMGEITGRTYYGRIAKDTVAMIVNDLIVVGALPKVVTAHFSVGESSWFNDKDRSESLLWGWADACDEAGATWGGGETPTLKGVLHPGVIELSGSAVGEISPKDRLCLGDKLQSGDTIILLASSGVHANGLTLARSIADGLPEGYATILPDSSTYGESLLTPTRIYVNAVRSLLEADIDIHYMANITGHGWRKLMRANRDLSYIIDEVPKAQPIFEFIQQRAGIDDTEMYGNYNMGAGFAVIVNPDHAERALEIVRGRGCPATSGGLVHEGPKQVIIRPKQVVFEGDSLGVR